MFFASFKVIYDINFLRHRVVILRHEDEQIAVYQPVYRRFFSVRILIELNLGVLMYYINKEEQRAIKSLIKHFIEYMSFCKVLLLYKAHDTDRLY